MPHAALNDTHAENETRAGIVNQNDRNPHPVSKVKPHGGHRIRMFSSLIFALALTTGQQAAESAPGQLIGLPDKDGKPGVVMPLKGTVVTADVAGIAARVTLVQTFINPNRTPIEAVYTFPMAATAAVDRMRIKVGDRIVEGEIRRAEEARAIYDAAKAAGQTAALLDQERPNIFTQSVANIMPGAEVQVEISYVELLKYEEGEFEFTFPMVVGPRNTMNANDPTKIAPPITPKGTRTGQNISLTVRLNSGMSLQSIGSTLHAININKHGAGRYDVTLARKDEIPNRDFILKWKPAGTGVTEGLLTHAVDGQGTFCLTLIPPSADVEQFATSREVVFVMDQSGSQSGFPLEKSKELTTAMIDKLRPGDVFNVVTFTTGVNRLWPEPRPNTPANVAQAKQFVSGLNAGGGTNFVPPLNATMSVPPVDGRLKLIVFNTDGFVGDDFDILQLVQNNRLNARLFTFGIGNSVNRFLIDGMSQEGRGASEIVTLASDVGGAIERFLKRTQTPVLTDVQIETEGGDIEEVTPDVVPDLFSNAPLVVFGRYHKAGPAKIHLSGNLGGQAWTRTIEIDLPANGSGSDGITKVWARKRLDDMVRKDWMVAAQSTRNGKQVTRDVEPFVQFALANGIMSQWTSFVAVEKRVVNIGGKMRTIAVPVEMADGVSYGDMEMKRMRGNFAGMSGGGGAGYGGASVAASNPPATTGLAMKSDAKSGEVDKAMKDANPALKIHKSLKGKTGRLEVQILVRDWPADWKKQLEAAGLKVDGDAKDLKVVFGSLDAKALEALSKLTFVDEIRPLG